MGTDGAVNVLDLRQNAVLNSLRFGPVVGLHLTESLFGGDLPIDIGIKGRLFWAMNDIEGTQKVAIGPPGTNDLGAPFRKFDADKSTDTFSPELIGYVSTTFALTERVNLELGFDIHAFIDSPTVRWPHELPPVFAATDRFSRTFGIDTETMYGCAGYFAFVQ